MRTWLRAGLAGLLGGLALVGAGCGSTKYSHVNRPLHESEIWPDCRGSLEIQQPRGEEDVLVILCLSGGGSRAAWFSASTMLRLENVVDEINLLHEVDVISSVSGGSLPAAYYCVTRDPGPYSVVRVEQLPESLPVELAATVKMDRQRGLLGVHGKMKAEQRDALLAHFSSSRDRDRVEHLFWLSNHTRAPAVWQPEKVRALMTRNYIKSLLWDSFSPLNCWEDWLYWTTALDRSDQMARIFSRNLFGAELVHAPKHVQSVTDLGFLGYLDRQDETAHDDQESSECDTDVLRWPEKPALRSPVRLDWLPGYNPARKVTQSIAGGVREVRTQLIPFVPYRFKDLNPERPYLILNATSASVDDPSGLLFGDVFTFTREDFKRHANSTIDSYDLAHAVMASAAFPGVFSFVTLRDFRSHDTNSAPRYLHVFDAGNSDNLGLESAKKVILANRDRYRHFVVLLVDSHVTSGASRDRADVRTRVLDINFMDSFSTLLDSVRRHEVAEFTSGILDGQNLAGRLTFWQLTFDDVRDPDLRAKANRIPTDFKINAESVKVVEECVNDLVRPDHPKLQEFLRMLRVSAKTARPPPIAGADAAPPAQN